MASDNQFPSDLSHQIQQHVQVCLLTHIFCVTLCAFAAFAYLPPRLDSPALLPLQPSSLYFMLCLGPGSSCDVCLDPFGIDLKGPCSIECGHVFCADCLDHISRQTCPLCRIPFDMRSIVRLHVDVDSCGAQSSAYAEARRLQRAIADVANEGTTEPRLRQLISECKAFLQSQSRDMFEDLRVSHRMIAYLCEVKSKLRSQSQEVGRLEAEKDTLHAEIERLEAEMGSEVARLEAERTERDRTISELERMNREERERARDAELESARKGMETQTKYIKQLEITDNLRMELEELKNELIRLSSGGFQQEPLTSDTPLIAISTPEPQCEDPVAIKELYGSEGFMISPFPEFTANTLPPQEFSSLPSIEDQPEENLSEEAQAGGYCGAAGCPLSCNCRPIQLFSMTEQTNALDLPNPAVPSLLSLTAPRADDSPCSLSSYSPSTPSDRAPIEDMPPTCPPSPPSPPVSNLQVERLRDLLTDSSPRMTSSLPSLTGSHFTGRDRAGSQSSTSSRRPFPTRLDSSPASLSPQPLSVPSVQPASGITPEVTTAAAVSQPYHLGPGLSRASSAAYALESAQRLNKERQKAERERRRAEKLDDLQADGSSGNASRPVSGIYDITVDSNYISSKGHSSYYGGAKVDVSGSKGHQSYNSSGIDSERSSYSNSSSPTSKMESRPSRSKHESSHYNIGVDGDRSPYPNPSALNSKTLLESRVSRSSSKMQQESSSYNTGADAERPSYPTRSSSRAQDVSTYNTGMDTDPSSYLSSSNLSSKMESRAPRSSSKLQQEAPAYNVPMDTHSNPSPKPESHVSRSSSKTQQEISQSSKQYIPIQREPTASYNYHSVSTSTSSSYRDHDTAMTHVARTSSSTASTQVKPTSSNPKDASGSYRQYTSSNGKSKLVPTSSFTTNVGFAHA